MNFYVTFKINLINHLFFCWLISPRILLQNYYCKNKKGEVFFLIYTPNGYLTKNIWRKRAFTPNLGKQNVNKLFISVEYYKHLIITFLYLSISILFHYDETFPHTSRWWIESWSQPKKIHMIIHFSTFN